MRFFSLPPYDLPTYEWAKRIVFAAYPARTNADPLPVRATVQHTFPLAYNPILLPTRKRPISLRPNPSIRRWRASRIPSPPSSSSPSTDSIPSQPPSQNVQPASHTTSVIREAPIGSTAAAVLPGPSSLRRQQPSPSSDSGFAVNAAYRDMAIDDDYLQDGSQGSFRDASPSRPYTSDETAPQHLKYDISGMPISDIIEMVAALLTKITSTNDLQHDAIQRNPLSTSVLAFHGKNVPAITILSYLSRIHRYCPTTYDVFLSLLVYFDRMTERVNDMVIKNEEAKRRASLRPSHAGSRSHSESRASDTAMQDDSSDSVESDSDLADDDDDDDDESMDDRGHSVPKIISNPHTVEHTTGPATYFVVDSFNIHRLIIAGVTCASKFFSDVFYTNSRYAKVGGLPLAELNHLELQFLLLNDFQLFVPVEDLEAYATMLVEFYAREIVSQRQTGDATE
ncbi:unnamed protein product [Parascedosporium putredinis]|uniref:Cyclin-domain-containing protein n=1 Tax=Parascedosporium putredinis TaxID=1442378 RepID=A0A9P1MBZ4_9PEZI|nr:unnamed protein product [Parascedosporium putredinis]CAI7997415.1 unnamed protein product [Parascedosporium putredinis]